MYAPSSRRRQRRMITGLSLVEKLLVNQLREHGYPKG
jgi:hypothetical protein